MIDEGQDTRCEVIAYTDGASRGNPGPAAAGFIMTDTCGNQLQGKAFFIGQTTNNIAEYTAILKALEAAKQLAVGRLTIFSDSELLVRQLNGDYKVKSEQIRPLFSQAVDLLGEFDSWKVQHIAREKNQQADKLVNRALNLERDVVVKTEATSTLRRSSGQAGQKTEQGRGTKDLLPRLATRDAEASESRTKTMRLGVLISGGGRTMENILEHIKQGKLNAEIAVVISSRSTVAGVEKAQKAGLNVKIIRVKDYPDIDEFSKHIEEELVSADVDLVVQGGWLCLWKIPQRYKNRVMNIHPALLPSFGGQGMWGHHVHEAVLAAGCNVSGCTVHFCTNEYDKGQIIVQRTCEVKDDDTPDTLAERVFEQECIAYPQAIKLFAKGKIRGMSDER